MIIKTIPEKYELSDDNLGLIAHYKSIKRKKFTYHIHKDELNDLEKWIKKILKNNIKDMKIIKMVNGNQSWWTKEN